MDLERFLCHVAEREAVTPELAREHTRAVLATRWEALTPKEWLDVTAQLPEDYMVVLARP